MRLADRMRRLAALTAALALGAMLAGCSGDDGAVGPAGSAGPAGTAGTAGVNCWDLNQNGAPDAATEDINKDGRVDVQDCRTPSGAYDAAALHAGYFTEHAYAGTQDCLTCHGKMGDEFMTTVHWQQFGISANVQGREAERHGKRDYINNFCIAVPSNEARCSECHAGYNWSDKNFDFGNPKNIDCLICHDQTGTYKKSQTAAGTPDPAVDLKAVARSVGQNDGVPSRRACILCHANAGGGDNIKHGDLSTDLIATTRAYDVHMGTDGANMKCTSCHGVKKDSAGKLVSHGIGGMPFHGVDEGALKDCGDCHGSRASVHAGTSVERVVRDHPRLACQVCHVPAIARKLATKTEWYWAEAGQNIDPIPVDPATGKQTYDKKKGRFVWQKNVRPTLLFHNGKWNKTMINVNDRYTALPAVMAAPAATFSDPDAMIYPFKKMVGNQAADRNNKTLLVPHLFGTKAGPNPYWSKFDWNLALQEGAAYAGQTYTGQYEFVNTVMYLSVNHEVAPKAQALGLNNNCAHCHAGQVDWAALGWSADPILGGTRPR